MARSNRTEFALLAMLAHGPKSGYDVRRMAGERLSHFWSENLGHIYPTLARLEKRGWIERAGAGTGPRRRAEFRLTAAGREALAQWFEEPPQPVPPRNELLLKLFFGRFAPEGAIRGQVERYRAARSADLERLEGLSALLSAEASADPDWPYWHVTLRAGVHGARAAVAWCDETLAWLDGERSRGRGESNERQS